MAAQSRLFSNADNAYIPYRFVENLFAAVTGGENLAQSNKVFDTRIGKIGVGVKTFTNKSSPEKIQEYTSLSNKGKFDRLNGEKLAKELARIRNIRIRSHADELNILLSYSIYHCLIRDRGEAFIHEEPYQLINVNNIQPVDKNWNVTDKFASKVLMFTDGQSLYSYSKSKSTLLKKFDTAISTKNKRIALPIDENIWNVWDDRGSLNKFTEKKLILPIALVEEQELQPGIDYVVLPLYQEGKMSIPEKSGINGWNAKGEKRKRKYGQGYIPVPINVRKNSIGFFPERSVEFEILIPNSSEPLLAKITQEEGKGLTSNPNVALFKWLFKLIDPDFKDSEFDLPPSRKPFTYDDLLAVDSDALLFKKLPSKAGVQRFSIALAPIGSYEQFLEDVGEI